MGVTFVCESQHVCGTNDQRWVVSARKSENGSAHWLSEDASWWGKQNPFEYFKHPNAFSGVVPLYQAVHPAVGGVAQHIPPGRESTRFFHWYPDQEHLSDGVNPRSFHHHISQDHFDRNLDWNARVIVMDLLLLVEQDGMLPSAKNRLLKKLFPVPRSPENDVYSSIKTERKGLWLFFLYFWQPTLNHFRQVFLGRREDGVANIAVGEVCHVLGITCRTQWMLNGFLCPSGGLTSSSKTPPSPFIEYLPCRFDRLLSLLQEHSDALREFVKDLADVYTLLKGRYLQTEVVFDSSFDQSLLVDVPDDVPKTPEGFYFPSTKHFLLSDVFYADEGGMCEDPREKNVYLFALLDVS